MKRIKCSVLLAWSIGFASLGNGQPAFFSNCAYDTGNNATLIIPLTATLEVNGMPLSPGSEVAAFTPDSLCAGVAIWDGVQPLVLTLWGDDPFITPDTKEGFAPGDTIQLAVWDKASGRHFHRANGRFDVRYASGDILSDNGHYQPDALYRIDVLTVHPIAPTALQADQLPTGAYLHPPYPNPFRRQTTLAMVLPQPMHVHLAVYTLAGQEIARLAEGPLPAGIHYISWHPKQLAAGLYLLRLTTNQTAHALLLSYSP
ncbi:hypothetical protein HRbin18_00594 [bacterium HR18]|nr:hypothetical protein HRbin18_00594 [bacterium HR18]